MLNINLDKEKLTVTGDIKNILKDSDDVVSLQAKGQISEENPIEIPMSLTGNQELLVQKKNQHQLKKLLYKHQVKMHHLVVKLLYQVQEKMDKT